MRRLEDQVLAKQVERKNLALCQLAGVSHTEPTVGVGREGEAGRSGGVFHKNRYWRGSPRTRWAIMFLCISEVPA